MPPTERTAGNSPTTGRAARSAPVCLEVAVTVRGAVLDEMTNQTNSFSESTRTILVFSGAAVLRLATHLTPGQTVMLVNENTKKEVRCEVLKSKTHGMGSGVFELEFSDRDENFWGMTFPGERPARKSSSLPEEKLEQKSAAPSSNLPLGVAPRVDTAYSGQADVTHFADAPAIPPAPAPVAQPAQVSDGPAWPLEERPLVKKDSELQSAPVLAEPPPPPPPAEFLPAPVSLAAATQTQESVPAWVEKPAVSIEPASVRFANDAAPVPVPLSFAPPPDDPLVSDLPAEPPKPKSPPFESSAPTDSSALPDFLQPRSAARQPLPEIAYVPSAGSRFAGFLLRASLAATIVLALAGGGWYLWRQPGRAAWISSLFTSKPSVAAAAETSTPAAPLRPLPAPESRPLAAAVPPAASSTYNAPVAPPIRRASEDADQPGFSLPSAAPGTASSQPEAAHSASVSSAPLFSKAENPSSLPIPVDPSLASRASAPASPASAPPGAMAPVTSAALPESGKPPKTAGATRPARLLSSVSPEYPVLARSQRISGDVVVDALVDVTGKVAAMKVVSGNVMLQRAAMDALRKWRYQPALQNGQPVKVHLQVTVQFRLEN